MTNGIRFTWRPTCNALVMIKCWQSTSITYLQTHDNRTIHVQSWHERVCDLHVVRHVNVKSIKYCSTLTNPTMESYCILWPLTLRWRTSCKSHSLLYSVAQKHDSDMYVIMNVNLPSQKSQTSPLSPGVHFLFLPVKRLVLRTVGQALRERIKSIKNYQRSICIDMRLCLWQTAHIM